MFWPVMIRKESTSVQAEVPDYRQFVGRDIKGWKIGIPKEYFIEGIDPEVSRRD